MQHQYKPAKKYDIIRKTRSVFVGLVEDGHHFVVVDVLDDYTAVVVGLDGSLKYLVYPEEYEVVGTAEELVRQSNEQTHKDYSEIDRKIAEAKANGTYVDPMEYLLGKKKGI